jgi:phage terminase Nu1 subunit (DNA packaging protein)
MEPIANAREVTLSELADLMQVTEARILRLVERQGLPVSHQNGRPRFHLDEVAAWMKHQSLAIAPRVPRRRSFDATPNHRA